MGKDKNLIGYIYCITNKITGKQYIGQTIRTVERRWSSHQTESKTEKKPSYFHKSIIKYGKNNFVVETIESISAITKDELKNKLNESEKKYIKQYNTIRPNGYNLTPGGDTSSFTRKRSIVQISKHGEIINVYESIVDALKALNLNEGSLSAVLCGYANMCHGYYWTYLDDNVNEFIKNIDNPYVCLYDSDGKLQKIYDSFNDASVDLDVSVSRLKQCCNGSRLHSKYRQFRSFKNKDDIENKISELVIEWGKSVEQYDLNNNYITTYKSIKDVISKNKSFTESTIRNCCSGFRTKAYDCIWKYI